MAKQPVILLAEDLEDDVFLIKRAFNRAKTECVIQVVRDGEEAIAYLSGEGKFSNREEYPLPWLVLLDLKMPLVDGFEVLKWLRQNPGLRSLIVIVLTASEHLRDVNEAYALGANSFMIKPLDFENTIELANIVSRYWVQWNRLPESTREPRGKIGNGEKGV